MHAPVDRIQTIRPIESNDHDSVVAAIDPHRLVLGLIEHGTPFASVGQTLLSRFDR
jgi:hypothetical protein